MPYKDPKLQKKYLANHYIENKSKYRSSNRKSKDKRANFVNSLKDNPCSDCKQKFHFSAMHFDHLRDKIMNINNEVERKSIEFILEEIKKCELVCVNCHSIRTYKRSHGIDLALNI